MDILERLRDLYRKKNLKELKSEFHKNMFFIEKDKRAQIQKAIKELEIKEANIQLTLDTLGGERID